MENLKFKGFCVANNIKQKDIAKILGITRTTANLKLNNKQPFTLEQVKLLCDAYKISADDFFI